MVMFSVNSTRIDPYANFRFLVVFGNDVVAGASKVSGLKQTVEWYRSQSRSSAIR